MRRRFINPKKFPTKSQQKYENITTSCLSITSSIIDLCYISASIYLSHKCLSRMIDLLQIETKVERNSVSHQKYSLNTLCSKITETFLKSKFFTMDFTKTIIHHNKLTNQLPDFTTLQLLSNPASYFLYIHQQLNLNKRNQRTKCNSCKLPKCSEERFECK